MTDRLSPLDASFLHLEDDSAHMHVAGVLILEGEAPDYEEFIEGVEARLHLVPRYRQKLAQVPLGQGRPRWTDDPHFNARFHIRQTALPSPGTERELQLLAGRVFSQQLDRDKPLWEMWLVEGLEGDRFAILSKTHHALVDGISGMDILSVLFAPEAEEAHERWIPRPEPSSAQLLAEALMERATVPAEVVRPVRALLRGPRQFLGEVRDALVGAGAMAWAGLRPAPRTPYNQPIGPHRRFTWARADLADVKAIKNELGGTVNDVVLTVVTRALRRHLLRRGVEVSGLTLTAMVPVSVRPDEQRGALGNQVAAMMAPLPVSCSDPATCLGTISEAMSELKESGQAVGAQVLTDLAGFAPPTIASQAARVVTRQRLFNLVVTNVPGPQFPLYFQGRQLLDLVPMVPLAANQGLGVAIVSYNGGMCFGLVADYDLVPDLDDLRGDFAAGLEELAAAAGVRLRGARQSPGTRRRVAPTNGSGSPARVGSGTRTKA